MNGTYCYLSYSQVSKKRENIVGSIECNNEQLFNRMTNKNRLLKQY
jgi:hypothetical protein